MYPVGQRASHHLEVSGPKLARVTEGLPAPGERRTGSPPRLEAVSLSCLSAGPTLGPGREQALNILVKLIQD